MYCIVRPGPYVCAEWDMGGLPCWLLKNKDVQVRIIEDDIFMGRSKRFLNKAGEKLAPLQIQNGGNIIMVQVENEYGVWGSDAIYMGAPGRQRPAYFGCGNRNSFGGWYGSIVPKLESRIRRQ